MSRNTSPEEALRQKLTGLPLPDEDTSWQKMNALLDEKEKRRGFFFFRHEKMVAGVVVLCALLLCIALFMQTGTEPATKSATAGRDNTDSVTAMPYHSANPETGGEKTAKDRMKKQASPDTVLSSPAASSVASSSANNKQSFIKKNTAATASSISTSSSSNHKLLFTKKNTDAKRKQNNKTGTKSFANDVKKSHANDERNKQNNSSDLQAGADSNTLTTPSGTLQKEILSSANDSILTSGNVINADTSSAINNHQIITDTKPAFTKTDSVSADNTAAKKSIRIRQHNAYSVDAGIGMKQQLPVGNQAFTTYNYNGNKGWTGDYIPSLYIKLEKEQRWFVQGEFYYAAPRLINKRIYRQITKADYGHGSTTTDKYYLQKTWYHQLPLSFNLYIHPSWSVGAGAMYNILRGASAKKETAVYNVALGHTVYSEDILSWKGYTDSFLYKTNTSLLLQTDYHVKRWSFGLRYLQDVQPYLTYTLPDGIKKDKRNASLEVLIRYELLRSGKFRLGRR